MTESRRFTASDAKTVVSRGCPQPPLWRVGAAYRVGETVARKYRLLELLGEGGMGTVWKAYYDTLDVHVALKVLRSDPKDAESVVNGGRLLQEARAAARLGHPAIARVFDYGVCDRGNSFIVMELLEGEDLAHALARRGKLSPKKAVATLLPIVHALATAHQKGIVHRDIKPDNIYLSRCEDMRVQPKLVDFGIAKVERGRNTRLTQTGEMLGSPMYMSPEQTRGDDVDHLADVWAISVVLYEMIAGTTPFQSSSYTGLLYAIVASDPVPLSELGCGDAALWEIIERGLDKDRHRRWSSMRELGEELAHWLASQGQRVDITGASLDQWFHPVGAKADLLVSVAPPRAEVTARPPASASLRPRGSAPVTEIEVDVSLEMEPEESTFTGGVLSVPAAARQARNRLAAIAASSAALGALIVASALFIQKQGPFGADSDAAAGYVIQLPTSTPVLPETPPAAAPSETSCASPEDVPAAAASEAAKQTKSRPLTRRAEPRGGARGGAAKKAPPPTTTAPEPNHRSELKNPFAPTRTMTPQSP